MANYATMEIDQLQECDNFDTHEAISRRGTWYCLVCQGRGRDLTRLQCDEIVKYNAKETTE